MNTATLQAELSEDPLGRGYSGMTDAERHASLTTADRPSTEMRFASLRTLAAELTDEEYATIKGVLTAVSASNVKVADMLAVLATPGNDDGTGGGLDFGSAVVRGMIDSFVTAELDIADLRLLDVIRAGRQLV